MMAAFTLNPFDLQQSSGYELHTLGDWDGDGGLAILSSYADTSAMYFNYYENQPLVSVREGRDLSADLTVFPNPAQDQVRFELPETALPGAYRTKVYDLQGRQVLDSSGLGIGQSGTLRIDGLSSGMYEVVMQGESISYRGRFMKQ